jgi:predicted RND superfamily exporter protein
VVRFCLRHKRLVLALWSVVLLGALAGLARRLASKDAIIDNSVGVWFMKDDPELKLYDAFNDDFGRKEWGLVLVETDAVFEPAFLRDLAEITGRIEKIEHVTKVVSITNVRDSALTADGLIDYRRLYPTRDPRALVTAEQARELERRLHANPIFERSVLSRQAPRSTVILFENHNFITDPRPYRVALVDSIKGVMAEYPRVRAFHLAGTSVINAELNRSSQHDVLVFYVLVTALICVVGYLSLRNWRDLSVVLAVVTAGALPPMALLGLLEIPYNMVTVMLPPILITLSVCDVVHVINGFHHERQSQEPTAAALAAVGKIWVPCAWTSVVTAVGFLSLTTSTVAPIRQMGLFSVAGIGLAWLVTMTGVPVLLVTLWPRPVPAAGARDGSKPVGLYARRLLALQRGRWRWVWLGVGAASLVALAGLRRLEVDTNYTKFFGRDMYVTRSYPAIRAAGYGENPIALVLRFAPGESYASPGVLPRLLDFEAAVRADGGVAKVMTFTDLLRRTDDVFNGEVKDRPPLRTYARAKLEQLFLLAELSGNEDLRDFVTEDKRTIQIVAMAHSMSSKDLELFKQRVYEAGRATLPASIDLKVTGTTVQWANMDKEISHTQMDSLYILSGVFLVLLPIIFRSVVLGAIGVLINGLPMAITLGLMGLLDIKINIATALIGGVAIGATVDSTIFFINRVRLELEGGLAWKEAVDRAVVVVGDGIMMTSLILAGGFFCLATSHFTPTADFGSLVSISIVISLFMDIVINPIVLRLLPIKSARGAALGLGLESKESVS